MINFMVWPSLALYIRWLGYGEAFGGGTKCNSSVSDKEMGYHAPCRVADPTVVKRMHHTMHKLREAIEIYEMDGLPTSSVMASLSLSKTLIHSVEKILKDKL